MSVPHNPWEDSGDFIEAERYELFADPTHRFEFDRREFMKVFAGGITLIVPLSSGLGQQGEPRRQGGEYGRGQFNQRLPNEVGAWIHIDEDGGVTVYTGKVEMGQNIRTSLTQAVAEELRVPVAMIRMCMGDTDMTPFDAGTFGSRTTPTMGLRALSENL